jgi:hypothetical protein
LCLDLILRKLVHIIPSKTQLRFDPEKENPQQHCCDAGHKNLWIVLLKVQAKDDLPSRSGIQRRQQVIPSIVEILSLIQSRVATERNRTPGVIRSSISWIECNTRVDRIDELCTG